MKVLSLFSGIGGFEIACERAGMEIVGQVEIDPFCQKVLAKHWPHVKRMDDVTQVRGDEFGAVDIIVGGVPCQPASVAGKRRGTDDDRWLWPEALRIIGYVRPRWFVFENPPGILSLQGGVPFDDILTEMEREGYEVGAYNIPACAVEAPHKRERVFIVGYAGSCGLPGEPRRGTGQEFKDGYKRFEEGGMADAERNAQRSGLRQDEQEWERWGRSGNGGSARGLADACEQRLPQPEQKREHARPTPERDRRPAQPGLGGMLDGPAYRLDKHRWPAGRGCKQYPWEPPRIATGIKDRKERLRALGNMLIPQQVYPILKAIAEIELEAQKGGLTP